MIQQVEITREELLKHFGPLSYEEIGSLLNKMTVLLEKRSMHITVRKKVYAAMVESLENIYKHQDLMEGDKDHGRTQSDATSERGDHPGDGSQQGGFPSAIRPNDSHPRPLVNGQVDL